MKRLNKPKPLETLQLQTTHSRQKSYQWSTKGSLEIDGLRIKDHGVISVDGVEIDENIPSLHHYKSENLASGQVQYNDSTLIKIGPLGQGACGSVFKAIHAETLQLVAVKEIPVHSKSRRKQLVAELKVIYDMIRKMNIDTRPEHSDCNSNRIVNFYNAYVSNQSKVCIVMEYLSGGSLQDLIQFHGKVEESLLRKLAYDCLHGLAFIHQSKYLHRDIKPGNFLLDSFGRVKIADFGLTKNVATPGGSRQNLCRIKLKGHKLKVDENEGDPTSSEAGKPVPSSADALKNMPWSLPSKKLTPKRMYSSCPRSSVLRKNPGIVYGNECLTPSQREEAKSSADFFDKLSTPSQPHTPPNDPPKAPSSTPTQPGPDCDSPRLQIKIPTLSPQPSIHDTPPSVDISPPPPIGVKNSLTPPRHPGRATGPIKHHRPRFNKHARAQTYCGTQSYMAPERLAGKGYSYASDVWSLGLSLLSCAVGGHPLLQDNDSVVGYWGLNNIYGSASPKRPDDANTELSLLDTVLSRHPHINLPQDARDFFSKCLKSQPTERATCEELQNHPFLLKPSAGFAEKVATSQKSPSKDEVLEEARRIAIKVSQHHLNKIVRTMSQAEDDSTLSLEHEPPILDSSFLLLGVQLGVSWTKIKEIFFEEWTVMWQNMITCGSFDDVIRSLSDDLGLRVGSNESLGSSIVPCNSAKEGIA